MSLPITEQLRDLIGRSRRPLVVTRASWDGDALAALLATNALLLKLGKQTRAACAHFSSADAQRFHFLPDIDAIAPMLDEKTTGVVHLNLTDHDGVEALSYRVDNNKLSIYLTPKRGEFRPDHIEKVSTEYPYDLILIIGSPDLDSLDTLYHAQRNLFFSTPTIVIDHRANNEHFGTVNIVDVTASSTSEIVAELIDDIDPALLDRNLSTTLLAGMIVATKNFTAPHLPPKTFARAGKLINAQAERDRIVGELFRQKTVEQLKLWGRALQNLREEADLKLVWTTLHREDFIETETEEHDSELLLHDLLSSVPDAEFVLLTSETPEGKTRHCFHATKHFPVAALVAPFNPHSVGSHRTCAFHTAHSSADAATTAVLNHIRTTLPQFIRKE
jgi:phosphoesterase RecJ-like protein